MVIVPVPATKLTAELRFPGLEGTAFIPACLADPAWESALTQRLLARATPYLQTAAATARELVPNKEPGTLKQRGDWHGDRCVLEVFPYRFYLKPKTGGPEEIVYGAFERLVGESTGNRLHIPFRRVRGFIVQEHIENTGRGSSRALGLALGFIFVFAVTDLNAENLRVRQGISIPIDVECAFDFDFYDCAFPTLVRRLCEQLLALKLSHPPPDEIARPGRELSDGFMEGALFAGRELALLAREHAQLDQLWLRRVLLPTRVYLDFIRRQTLFRADAPTVRRRWMDLRGASVAVQIAEAEARALGTGNIPFFHQQGEFLLDGSDGMRLLGGLSAPRWRAGGWTRRWTESALRDVASHLNGAGG